MNQQYLNILHFVINIGSYYDSPKRLNLLDCTLKN